MKKKLVAVAMSGGIDSSVAAVKLKLEGYDVIGLTMKLWDVSEISREDKHVSRHCCSLEMFDDARSVCFKYDIPHYVLNMHQDFNETVIEDFVSEYVKGRTPNPCVVCNYKIKWELLEHKTKQLGCDFLATGHYARISREGIPWPCPNIEHPGTPILHREQFTRGKGMFHAVDYVPPAEKVDADYPLYLTTGRLLYQYHTGTMTMRTEGLNEIAPYCHVEISAGDAKHYGISDHALVTIASRRGSIQAMAMVSPKAVTGTVFIPFHYAKAAANRLTHAALDPISGIPEFKVCAVKLLSKTA